MNNQAQSLVNNEGYLLTFTGKRFYPAHPESLDVCIEDIAHALSNVCRYNGHLMSFYSVAQHCVYISKYIEEHYNKYLAIVGLLHDASEAYLPDMPSPIKDTLPDFRKLEARLHKHIFDYFKLDWPYSKIIKEIDTTIRQDEIRDLASWGGNEKGIGISITSWSPNVAEKEFLTLYAKLHT